MAAKSKAQSNEEVLLAQWAAALETAQKSAAKAQADEVGHRQSLTKALQDAYDLGKSFTLNEGLAQQFVAKSLGKWDAYAKRNIFIPVVNHLFATTGDTQRSKYAAVLLYATKKMPENTSIKEWVFGDEHTLEERYSQAVNHSSKEHNDKPEVKAHKKRKTDIRVEIAKKQLHDKRLCDPIAIASLPKLESEYATVLVRRTDDGKIELVEFVDTDYTAVSRVLKRWSKPSAAARIALEGKELYRLFRAIEIVHLLSAIPGAGYMRHLVIEADKSDAQVARIFAVSNANNFRVGMVTLKNHGLPFSAGSRLTLPNEVVKTFIESYIGGADWTIKAVSDVYTLHNKSDDTTHSIVPLLLEGNKIWRAGRFKDFEDTAKPTVSFDASYAERFGNWIEAVKEQLAKKNSGNTESENFRPVVKMTANKSYVFTTLINVPGPSCELLGVLGNLTIPEDRFLVVEDVRRLAKVTELYGLSLHGVIADGDQKAVAIRLEQALSDDDTLVCVIPIAVSRTGEYAECCVDFQTEPVAAE